MSTVDCFKLLQATAAFFISSTKSMPVKLSMAVNMIWRCNLTFHLLLFHIQCRSLFDRFFDPQAIFTITPRGLNDPSGFIDLVLGSDDDISNPGIPIEPLPHGITMGPMNINASLKERYYFLLSLSRVLAPLSCFKPRCCTSSTHRIRAGQLIGGLQIRGSSVLGLKIF